MNDNVFSLRDFSRSYILPDSTVRLVTYVSKLDIPRGKITFILGESGSGKTSILETLGLMYPVTNSFVSQSKVYFHDSTNEKIVEYGKLWNNNDELAELRCNSMAFMFQEAHFLPGYTILDNIRLSVLAQQSATLQAVNSDYATEKAFEALSKVFDDEKVVKDIAKSKPNEISVGQRQRCAFARAIVKDFQVLFADEPTSSLGSSDEKKVMNNIRDYIKESNSRKSAIIVTHKLEIALKFADYLVIIPRNGIINPEENVFIKDIIKYNNNNTYLNGWNVTTREDQSIQDYFYHMMGKDENKIPGIKLSSNDLIIESQSESPDSDSPLIINPKQLPGKSLIDPVTVDDVQTTDTKKNDIQKACINKKFNELFEKSDDKEMRIGKRNSILFWGLLTFALLSLGFGFCGWELLDERMNDPFTQWIDLPYSPENTTVLSVS